MITLPDAKSHLRVEQDFTEEDSLIEALIDAAISHAEKRTGQSVAYTEGARHVIDRFPADRQAIELPWTPVKAVTNVEYTDATGATQTLNAGELTLDNRGVYPTLYPAYPNAWPSTQRRAMSISITASIGSDTLAPDIRMAILLLVAHYYAHREGVIIGTISSELPLGVEMLLAPYVIHPAG